MKDVIAVAVASYVSDKDVAELRKLVVWMAMRVADRMTLGQLRRWRDHMAEQGLGVEGGTT